MSESQPTLEGMPEPLYSAAPARLTTYLDCPRRYRLGYLDRPPPGKAPPGAYASVGAAVHLALARWWDVPLQERTAERGGELLVASWRRDGFRDDRQCDVARDRARTQVVDYLRAVDPGDEPLGVERTVSLPTSHAFLWGRVDRIDDRGGEGVVVVDYKTGRSVLTVDDARGSLALAVYAAATAHTVQRPCRRVELHHLPTGQVLAWEHTEGSLREHVAHADAVAAELSHLERRMRRGMSQATADEAFPARVASRCGSCEVRAGCAPGQQVPRRMPWAGMEG